MKKKIIIIIIITIILAIIAIISIYYYNSTNRKIKKILKDYKFTYKEGIYTKQKSELDLNDFYKKTENNIDTYYEELDFVIKNYTLSKLSLEHYKDIYIIFNSEYTYKNNNITFSFITTDDIEYYLSEGGIYTDEENNINTNGYLFEGTYSNDNSYDCQPKNTISKSLSYDEKNTICNAAYDEVTNFYKEANELFEGTNIKDRISKK